MSYGIWYPSIARVHVTTAHGVHFTSMGHSVARTPLAPQNTEPDQSPSTKPTKRLELLPEEAIYLIERGALFCYKFMPDTVVSDHTSPGAPMSVQQAYAEMIGCEDMTLERYQVYMSSMPMIRLFYYPSPGVRLSQAPRVRPDACNCSNPRLPRRPSVMLWFGSEQTFDALATNRSIVFARRTDLENHHICAAKDILAAPCFSWRLLQ